MHPGGLMWLAMGHILLCGQSRMFIVVHGNVQQP